MASSGTQCKPQSSRGLPYRLSALADSPSPPKAPRRVREGRWWFLVSHGFQLAAQIEKAEPWNRERPPIYG